MATYNPRAGMPKRKTYKFQHKAVVKTVTVENTQFAPKGLPPVQMHEIAPPMIPAVMDANALRGWLLGYMDSIGDQLPDLAQWRRIREEVGRSVVVKEPVKDTAVPVKKAVASTPASAVNYDEVLKQMVLAAKERERQRAEMEKKAEQKRIADLYMKPPAPLGGVTQTLSPHNHYWGGMDLDAASARYTVGIGADGQLYHLDNQGNRKNLCGND
jgi:hypothetical protein